MCEKGRQEAEQKIKENKDGKNIKMAVAMRVLCTCVHPDVLVNIEDSKIASEFISFRDDVASSMELLSYF